MDMEECPLAGWWVGTSEYYLHRMLSSEGHSSADSGAPGAGLGGLGTVSI